MGTARLMYRDFQNLLCWLGMLIYGYSSVLQNLFSAITKILLVQFSANTWTLRSVAPASHFPLTAQFNIANCYVDVAFSYDLHRIYYSYLPIIS